MVFVCLLHVLYLLKIAVLESDASTEDSIVKIMLSTENNIYVTKNRILVELCYLLEKY